MSNTSHFYVDESGDLALFDKRGRVIVGKEGCSHFFMVGIIHVHEPVVAREYLNSLRADLLQDSYFKSVPSMRPEARKTALAFHAKDDCAEVRREVFQILKRLDGKVQVAIRRKDVLASRYAEATPRSKRFEENSIYDDLVKRLFKNVLHKADRNQVVFARRGKRGRILALASAIESAKRNFERSHGVASDRPTDVFAADPHEHAGLQMIDYYLWALQRLFERHEIRYFDYLRPAYRLIMDLDDERNNPYGEWYSEANPLTLERIKAAP